MCFIITGGVLNYERAMATHTGAGDLRGAEYRRVEADTEREQRDVLEAFAGDRPRTARMVAEEVGVDRRTAERLLTELEARGELTRARAGTAVPVWFRPPERR